MHIHTCILIFPYQKLLYYSRTYMHTFDDHLFWKFCWHIRSISKRDYSSASFQLDCCFLRHVVTTNSFRKVAASWKVYDKQTNNCEQFVNAFVPDERCCSPSLPLQQAKKLIGKCCVESGRSWQGWGGWVGCSVFQCEWRWVCEEMLLCSSSKIPVWYKFSSDVLTLKYTRLFQGHKL